MKNRIPKIEPYRRDIFVPAYREKYACTIRVRLTAKEVPEVQALADKLGMSLDGLIDCYVSREQPMCVRFKDPPPVKLERIALLPALSSETMVRLSRAAVFYETSVETFIADAIAGQIHGAEDSMLLDPRNGQLLGEDFLVPLLLRDVEYYKDGKEK